MERMDKSKHTLNHLVVKPDLRCTANCPTCALRRELHKNIIKERRLTIDEWKDFFLQASRRGVKRFDISGGEPTLYPHLPELIREARKYGWYVQLNTNGSRLDGETIGHLVECGLNRIMVSLYSASPEIHDQMRRSPGLWRKAVDVIGMSAKIAARKGDFSIITQTLLCEENLRELPAFVLLQKKIGSSGIAFSYLEGNFDKKLILSDQLLRDYRETVLPELLEISRRFTWPLSWYQRRQFRKILSESILPAEAWATGQYNVTLPDCGIPRHMALVLANGDIHPCNIVEYTHKPVMGNMLTEPFEDIWNGDSWREYYGTKHDHCRFCPMNLQVYVPLKISGYLFRAWKGMSDLLSRGCRGENGS
jgi:MoaA/NifB/PqqE/SkfB family radical SAM enzyme